MEKSKRPSFEQERYFNTVLHLESDTHYDLMCDFYTIREAQECIEYVMEEQTRDNDRTMSESEDYAKWEYARYYMACKTAKFLADYTITLMKELESKFDTYLLYKNGELQ